MAAHIKAEFKIESVLAKGRAASFEITYKGKTVFSKLAVHRFPRKEEVLAAIRVFRASEKGSK